MSKPAGASLEPRLRDTKDVRTGKKEEVKDYLADCGRFWRELREFLTKEGVGRFGV